MLKMAQTNLIEALHGVCQEACSIQDIEKREKRIDPSIIRFPII